MTPVSLCACGCGQQTSIATHTSIRHGRIKGQPVKYLHGHNTRGKIFSPETLKHGHHTATSIFAIWSGMIKRCSDPTCPAYKWYGGRGIKVCERWLTFANFLADMGERPLKKSLDRYPDGDGNYEPGNVRWATQKEQMRNSSCARFLTVDGATRTYREWEELLGLSRGLVHSRVKAGFSPEECVSTGGLRWKRD